MADSIFREVEISELALTIVRQMAETHGDIDIKIAALRAAADVLTQAVITRSLAASIASVLLPPAKR